MSASLQIRWPSKKPEATTSPSIRARAAAYRRVSPKVMKYFITFGDTRRYAAALARIEGEVVASGFFDGHRICNEADIVELRSEERRVGKECRARCWWGQ